jgi:hypothetical protein
MIKYAIENLNAKYDSEYSEYDISGKMINGNCADFVSGILEAGDLYINKTKDKVFGRTRPNTQYRNFIKNNEGYRIKIEK